MSGRESGDIDSFPSAAHALTRTRRCRGLLLDLRPKLGDLGLEDALAHEVGLRVGREDLGQVAAIGLELARLPVEGEQHHPSVLGALRLDRPISDDRIEGQVHILYSSRRQG